MVNGAGATLCASAEPLAAASVAAERSARVARQREGRGRYGIEAPDWMRGGAGRDTDSGRNCRYMIVAFELRIGKGGGARHCVGRFVRRFAITVGGHVAFLMTIPDI